MKPARSPRDPKDSRLLVVDAATRGITDRAIRDLPSLIAPKDLVVLNDAATLPGSLEGRTPSGERLEVRLAGQRDDGRCWRAVLFGAGDWRTPTEHRPSPPLLRPGDQIDLGPDLLAHVARVSSISPRLLDLDFGPTTRAQDFWRRLYERGRPIQYSYLERGLSLAEVQTAFGTRPWAAEMPSAGRPLSWSLLFEIIQRGATVRALTHAAGLSSTGDRALDQKLPLSERYEIPPATARAFAAAKSNGGRVIAIGTTVVRALEAAALKGHGVVEAGSSVTALRIDRTHPLLAVDVVLTGVHDPTESHFALLEAFAPRALLEQAHEKAEALDYLGHEFGDSCWIVADPKIRLPALRPGQRARLPDVEDPKPLRVESALRPPSA